MMDIAPFQTKYLYASMVLFGLTALYNFYTVTEMHLTFNLTTHGIGHTTI